MPEKNSVAPAKKNQVPLEDRIKIERTRMPEQDPNVRNRNFEEVNLGLDPAAATNEATRCISCANRAA